MAVLINVPYILYDKPQLYLKLVVVVEQLKAVCNIKYTCAIVDSGRLVLKPGPIMFLKFASMDTLGDTF